ncbi:MAG: DUF4395 domain-containing protein [Cytophagaceae bacterium]|nr:DUF4395 domain-containing protein [Cytophagaceae bacterium]MBK9934477.1 DUF4395 domain-containing protein [Cytophagaceae bacterium]MBL0300923.1 DUF4395 domain-containing protein [Cytophagaceae bacterium]MBL0323737.1 DUF4395 domain-containing protein [Cytophagaceae bacterium]
MKQFGETVAGYDIPVLNEREIRGAAGILFLLLITSFWKIIFGGDFIMIKYFIPAFMTDMAIRIFISPKYSPSLVIARFLVRNQTPLYVGAAQKKFAWYIGFGLSAAMFIHIDILNAYGPVTGLTCLICMIFMFSELAFNYCIGCKIYGLFYKGQARYCPGEICELKDRQEIQKTNASQWIAVVLFLAALIVIGYFSKDYLSIKPQELMEVIKNW